VRVRAGARASGQGAACERARRDPESGVLVPYDSLILVCARALHGFAHVPRLRGNHAC
jgi:hypothetical protein